MDLISKSNDERGVVVTFPKRHSAGSKSPGLVDRHVGTRIKERRIQLGLSQEKLAETLGITFQQVQKYEKGTNRVGAGRLLAIATALGVPISFFFDGYAVESGPEEGKGDPVSELQTLLATREGIALAQAFLRIEKAAVRQALVTLAQAAAKDEP